MTCRNSKAWCLSWICTKELSVSPSDISSNTWTMVAKLNCRYHEAKNHSLSCGTTSDRLAAFRQPRRSYVIYAYSRAAILMMTSSNGNSFRVTGPLCGEFTGHRWIPLTKARDAELWCFLCHALNTRLSKQSLCWWFETSVRSLWRHCNVTAKFVSNQYVHPGRLAGEAIVLMFCVNCYPC